MSSSSRSALSILEVLICLVILAFALVPILNLFTSSHRIGHSARRFVDASMYGQTILEGVSMLEPADLPTIAPGSELILLDGATGQPQGRGRRAGARRARRARLSPAPRPCGTAACRACPRAAAIARARARAACH